MAVEYFNYLTLTTGHLTRVYPDDVDKELYLQVQSVVKDAVRPEGVEIFPNIRLKLTILESAYVGTFSLIDEDCLILSAAASLEHDAKLW